MLNGADLSRASLANAVTNASLTSANLNGAKFCRTIMVDGKRDNKRC